MGLFHPAQLAWIVLALVVVLYFLIRRRAVEVSSHLLWQRVAQQQRVWRRTQRWISAALVILLLAILAFVLAEPYWKSQQRAARTIVVVVQPEQETFEPSRLSSARAAALRVVESMQLYERVAIVVGGGPPHVACPLTDDRVKLRQAIEATRPAAGPDSGVEATDLARWMIAAQPNPTVILLKGDDKADTEAIAASAIPRSSEAPGVWLLLAALALCGGEWVLFSRRVTV